MLEFTEWYEGWMIQVLGTMSIPMLGDSRCLARWPGGLVEPAVLHYSSYLFSERFGWVKNTWSFLAVGSESLATPGRKGVRHLGFLILESRWLLQKTSKCIVDKGLKDWKYKNHPSLRSVSIQAIRGKNSNWQDWNCLFLFLLEGLLSNIFDLLYLIDAEQGNMSCSRIRQMRIQRPLGFIFQKSVEEGGVCVVWRRGLLAGSSPLSRYL